MVSSARHSDSSAVPPPEDTALWRTNRYPELRDLASRQLGVVSREQLRVRGWSRHRVDTEITAGRWTEVAPTVIALQNVSLDRRQRMWLGVLHAGPMSALSHSTACEVAGLRWTVDPTIHVLTAKSDEVSRLPGFWFRQSRRYYRDWLERGSELPRLRIEHAALLTAERDRNLRRAIGLLAAAVQQRLTTPNDLLLAVSQIRKLRHGKMFALALGDIAGGAESFAEIDVGRLCQFAGLEPPTRQRMRVDATGRTRFLDCEWELPDGRILVLEIDGSFHMRSDHWWRDMQRERAVVLTGRAVLRCSSVEVRLDPDAIVDDLRRFGVPTRFVRNQSA